MAIDTAEKRRSAAGVPHLPLGPGVTADASKPAIWRQEACWGYSGIPVNPTPPPSTGIFTVSGEEVQALFVPDGTVSYPYHVTMRTN